MSLGPDPANPNGDRADAGVAARRGGNHGDGTGRFREGRGHGHGRHRGRPDGGRTARSRSTASTATSRSSSRRASARRASSPATTSRPREPPRRRRRPPTLVRLEGGKTRATATATGSGQGGWRRWRVRRQLRPAPAATTRGGCGPPASSAVRPPRPRFVRGRGVGCFAAGPRSCDRGAVQRHGEPCFRYAWHLLGRREDAEDATQATFLAVHARWRAGRPCSSRVPGSCGSRATSAWGGFARPRGCPRWARWTTASTPLR